MFRLVRLRLAVATRTLLTGGGRACVPVPTAPLGRGASPLVPLEGDDRSVPDPGRRGAPATLPWKDGRIGVRPTLRTVAGRIGSFESSNELDRLGDPTSRFGEASRDPEVARGDGRRQGRSPRNDRRAARAAGGRPVRGQRDARGRVRMPGSSRRRGERSCVPPLLRPGRRCPGLVGRRAVGGRSPRHPQEPPPRVELGGAGPGSPRLLAEDPALHGVPVTRPLCLVTRLG